MRKFLLLCTFLLAAPATAQDPITDVLATIEQLFDGMRQGDSTMVRSTFHSSARLQTSMVRDGEPMLHTGSVNQFVQAVGTPHEQVWDERVWNVDVRIDGNLSQVWMDYAFFLGEEFSHCGVNALQFVHDGESWKILQLTDTRRTEECEVPEEMGERQGS